MSYIYKITNTNNDKVYIGQTINSLYKRLSKHKGKINCKNQCSALYSAMRKYGVDSFNIESIIEGDFSKEELNQLEVLFINKFQSLSPNGYNLQSGGTSGFWIAECVKERISKALKGRNVTWGGKTSKTLKDKWSDIDYRQKMSDSHKGKRGEYKEHTKPLRLSLPIDEINELYNSGLTIYKLTKKYNVSYDAIKKRIKQRN